MSGLTRATIVAILLLVAVLGIRARADVRLDNTGLIEPRGLTGYAFVGIAVLAAAVALFTLYAALKDPALPAGPARRRRPTSLLGTLVAVLLLWALLLPLIRDGWRDRQDGRGPNLLAPRGLSKGSPPPQPSNPDASPALDPALVGIASTLLLIGALALLAAAIVMTLRRVRQRGMAEEDEEGAALGGAADSDQLTGAVTAGRTAMERPDDPRAAVIACYAAMERYLAEAGSPRRPADTPTELLQRAVAEGTLRSGPARTLTALFHEARYSNHPLDENARRTAFDTLEQISADLAQARERTP